MTNFNDIFKGNDNTDKVYLLVKEKFDLNIDAELNEFGYRFSAFHEIHNLVDNIRYFTIGIEEITLSFQDHKGLLEVLVKFIDKKISDIPNELEALENERAGARYWDEVQHYHETEALSEKDGKLNRFKNKLLKELK